MASNVVTGVAMDLFIADLVAGDLAAAKVGLFIGAHVLTEDTVYADLTGTGNVPTYTGYLEQSAVFGAATRREDGSYVTRSHLLTFQPTGGSPNDVITGYYVSDGGGTAKLLFAAVFDDPIPINSVSAAVPLVAEFVLGPGYPGSPVLVA